MFFCAQALRLNDAVTVGALNSQYALHAISSVCVRACALCVRVCERLLEHAYASRRRRRVRRRSDYAYPAALALVGRSDACTCASLCVRVHTPL